jgi:hypothetical protein
VEFRPNFALFKHRYGKATKDQNYRNFYLGDYPAEMHRYNGWRPIRTAGCACGVNVLVKHFDDSPIPTFIPSVATSNTNYGINVAR